MNLKSVEKISKALSDVNRLKILKAIQSSHEKLECSTIVSFLNLSQPSISHHIKKLVEADLIEPQKEGRFYYYSLNKDVWESYLKALEKL
ncbi:ArsR family transcriptional regulator [Flagellimonas taeanensis]|uniref:ArsR/SmtB family transcription factor n=1 Tax=Flavobacteriaceae TaxID=49546 RepID=UPI000E6A7BD3|nr:MULTISPECIES: metalloregulator ArsR/SmtB family transcription factor [Allomuricauda]MDC6386991.1 metalloregulator ArsR/SmtB family transcription factor [Muricauda sp. SK9]RIV51487.1 ArsR family transcriptional regulator [Allomuricauda taeanensis]